MAFRVSLSQAVAATLATIALSAGITWWVTTSQATVADPAPAAVAARFVADPPADARLADELLRLEEVLLAEQERLDPHTQALIEKNLRLIERSIAEATEALRSDPQNQYVAEHLQRSYERKAQYLREAIDVVERSS